MARPWPAASVADTIHCVGDTHFGPSNGFFHAFRSSMVQNDLLFGKTVPKGSAMERVQVGDAVEHTAAGNFTDFKNWKNAIPGTWRGVIGNHDISGNALTGDQASTSIGMNARNWTRDYGFAKGIGLSPARLENASYGAWIQLDTIALDYLEDELASATKDCIIFAHAPLYNTVIGDQAQEYTSQRIDFWLHPSTADSPLPPRTVEDILEASPRAKMFISGHTHSSFAGTTSNMLKTHDLGNRNIVALNSSALYYTGVNKNFYDDPLRTFFVTWAPPNIEVRVRNHSNSTWDGIGGVRIRSVPIPA